MGRFPSVACFEFIPPPYYIPDMEAIPAYTALPRATFLHVHCNGCLGAISNIGVMGAGPWFLAVLSCRCIATCAEEFTVRDSARHSERNGRFAVEQKQ